MQETQETWVQSLGQEDSLEKEVATCSSVLAWEIPWAEEPGELQSMGLHGLFLQDQATEHASTHTYLQIFSKKKKMDTAQITKNGSL